MDINWSEVRSILGTAAIVITFLKWATKKSQKAMKAFVAKELSATTFQVCELSAVVRALIKKVDLFSEELERLSSHQVSTKVAVGELSKEVRMSLDEATRAFFVAAKAIEDETKALARMREDYGKVIFKP